MEDEIVIGAIFKMLNYGSTYANADDFAIELGLTRWEQGELPKIGNVFLVKSKIMFKGRGTLAGIEDVETHKQFVYGLYKKEYFRLLSSPAYQLQFTF